ncbi:hypothetical protein ILUMI_16147 [Ignelater luminosus]|uniref:HTH psq-type domain-containing protein n=1 Tax=Ignelater luminosus TaxID=2038154 RepID=A0A8K0G8U4_IGNLU|nr:hypothetical protein ILUMI_16147 [Ignelater luminosus]
MVRTYKSKTDRGSIDEENIKTAITDVLSKRLSIRKAADKCSIKAATLQHRIEKFRKKFDENEASSSNAYGSWYTVAQNHGKKCAGKDWAAGFRKRNQELSLRKPENMSAARCFAFNKTAVTEFFENYERVNTVLPTPKVLAEKKQRQVGQIVSAERGQLATFCGIVTATGAAFPPVYVNFKEHFLNSAPEGSLGKTLSIYNTAELSKLALLESFTPKNITSGFSKPGIWTFNRLAFDDDDFAPIEIFQDVADENRRNKDRHEVDFVEMEISQNDDAVENYEEDEIPVTETDPLGNRFDVVASPNVVPSGSTLILPPESVRPYPKKVIAEKTSSKKERQKGKSRLFSDSSKRDRLRKLYEQIQIIKQRARELKTARNLLDLQEIKKILKK